MVAIVKCQNVHRIASVRVASVKCQNAHMIASAMVAIAPCRNVKASANARVAIANCRNVPAIASANMVQIALCRHVPAIASAKVLPIALCRNAKDGNAVGQVTAVRQLLSKSPLLCSYAWHRFMITAMSRCEGLSLLKSKYFGQSRTSAQMLYHFN